MINDYIIENYIMGEPILVEEIPASSKNYVRQRLKKMVDDGVLARFCPGVFYLQNDNSEFMFDEYIKKKYLMDEGSVVGFLCGDNLLFAEGLITKMPNSVDVCTNKATTYQRRIEVQGHKINIFKPAIEITEDNFEEIRFLSLVLALETSCDINDKKTKLFVAEYIKKHNVNLEIIRDMLPFCLDKVFKDLYLLGVLDICL